MARERPDIVFMDIHMPGMDGLEARQRIVEAHAGQAPRIVAVSASTLAHEQQRFLEEGFDAYIGKPFRREQLCAVLADLLAVEYRYAVGPSEGPDEATPAPEPPDVAGISLPEELRLGLAKSARQQNMTDLHRRLDAMAELGDAERALAAHLRSLSESYDLGRVRSILEQVGAHGE